MLKRLLILWSVLTVLLAPAWSMPVYACPMDHSLHATCCCDEGCDGSAKSGCCILIQAHDNGVAATAPAALPPVVIPAPVLVVLRPGPVPVLVSVPAPSQGPSATGPPLWLRERVLRL